MANYKRGKCRNHVPRAIRGSMASWRAKHNFRPIKLTKEDWQKSGAAWNALWLPNEGLGNKGRKTGYLDMMSSYPAWWDRIFHTRPRRNQERMTLRAIVSGQLDPEEAVWPLPKKPHSYYW